nr:hypothetical protein CFP56_48671 [Quercus suber]
MLQWALQYLEEYYATMELTQSPLVPVVQGLSWTSPPDLSFKINVDGATFSELGAVGIDVIVRDDQGFILESDSLSLFHALTGLSPSPSSVDCMV